MKLLKKLLWILLLFLFTAILLAVGYYYTVTKDAKLYPEKLSLERKNVLVYDKDANPIEGVSLRFEQTADIRKLSEQTVRAFVDTEDKRFFSHNGFDYKRIAKAVLNNAKSHSFKEGASTISQQLVKNTHLSQEKTFKRKLQEWKLTRELENRYSKTEILEKYLNTIYFGHNCFGIYSACEFYFGKSPENLTLGEAAVLAGLVKSPNNYSPFKNPKKCAERKASVLTAMLRNGTIEEREKAAALTEKLPVAPNANTKNDGYLHFVFDELTELSESHSFKLGEKVEIYTYLEKSLQTELERIADGIETANKSLLVLDLQTNGFKAAYSDLGNAPRLPGSLIKPLAVYAPALEENLLSPASPILDEPVDYHGYRPENYDKTYRGYVSTRECVAKSLNVPAVKTLSALTLKKSAAYLRKMRLEVPDEDLSLALALGGMQNGFTLRDLVRAYSVFPHQGTLPNVGFIQTIKINGKTVYTKEQTTTKAFGKETSYLMTDMLRTAAKSGTAKKLRSLPYDVAAKTGTVGQKTGNTDAYALSYTTKDCLAVHLYNRDNTIIDETGGGTPCNALYELNEFLYRSSPPNGFPVPEGVSSVALDKTAYYDRHTLERADTLAPSEYRFTEVFKNSEIPTKQSVFFSVPHISEPKITVRNDTITLSFDERFPTCYRYKIERIDYVTHSNYVTHTTVYFGDYTPEFVDADVCAENVYQYRITPVYNDRVGTAVTLPNVCLQQSTPPILEQEWWNK